MGPLLFTVLSVAIALLWLPKGLVKMPVAPRALNLPVLFSALFLMFYTQHIFFAEVIFGIPVSQWLVLIEPQRDMALLFLLCYFAVFWLAYAFHAQKCSIRRSVISVNSFAAPLLITVLAYGSLVVYIDATGGLHQFMTNHRQTVYLDQWSRNIEAIFTNQVRMVTGFIFTLAAILGGYFAGRDENAQLWKKVLYFSLVLPGALVRIALLSRGFFLPLALFFLAKTVSSKKRHRYFGVKILVLTLLALAGAVFSIQARATDALSLGGTKDIILFASNTINGLSPFLDTVALSSDGFGGGLQRILLELSPIPSFIYSSSYTSNLSTLAFGHTSGSSAPMPFIGEAFFNMGWGGLAVAYLQGFMAALVNSKVANPMVRDRAWWLMLYIMTIYSFLYMPHSGIRSCTRPLVWVFTLYGIWTLLRMIAPKKRRAAERFPARRANAHETADTH